MLSFVQPNRVFLVVDQVCDEVITLLQQRRIYFLDAKDPDGLATFIHENWRINPDIVGQTAYEIAGRDGL